MKHLIRLLRWACVPLWRQHRRRRHDRREVDRLDPHALRDLGLHRSELLSYRAESAGDAQLTRRRVHLRGG